MAVMLGFRRQRQEDQEFPASLGNLLRPSLKTQKQQETVQTLRVRLSRGVGKALDSIPSMKQEKTTESWAAVTACLHWERSQP